MQKRVLLQFQRIRGEAVDDQIREIDNEIFNLYSPKSFQGRESLEVQFIKGFERTVILLSKHTGIDPKKMTVLSFYQALETVSKELKTKANGKPN